MEKETRSGLDTYSELVMRTTFANMLGISHNGTRNLYGSFGYPEHLSYTDFTTRYSRQDIAKAVITRPVSATWAGDLLVSESGDAETTDFEKTFQRLTEDLGLKTKFARLDRLTCLGHYGVLLLGLSDTKTNEDFRTPVTKTNLKLNYVKPVGEGSASINTYNNDPMSERYGLPETYNISLKGTTGANGVSSLIVHHTRCIHVIYEALEDEVEGAPVLEDIYNRLMDLEKLVGGSAEMFWRGARPGFQGEIEKDFSITPEVKEQMDTQVSEYENNLRRLFMMQGVKLNSLAPQVSDPSAHVQVQVQMISSVKGIPLRILLGSEAGELASGQDSDAWKSLIQNRRLEFAEPCIVRPFIEKMVRYGVLPMPNTDNYTVLWSDLYAPSEKERAAIGLSRATAIQAYLQNPTAPELFPPELFVEFMAGLNKNQIDLWAKIKETAPKLIMPKEETDPEPLPE